MTLTINGTTRDDLTAQSLDELLQELRLDARAVVVEHNRVIVRRHALSDTTVTDGDVVEIVHFVGGG